jgi:hypothetical protein
MPNGHDKNWVRLCAAIDGFRSRYGRWPNRVRLSPLSLGDFDFLFTPADLTRIISKVALIADDEAAFVAEDDSGGSYNYGEEGFPKRARKPRAAEWLGVTPKPDYLTSYRGLALNEPGAVRKARSSLLEG